MDSPLRILHLEDNPNDAEIVKEALADNELPCKITRVETGEAFTAALERERFDLILSDYSLPTLTGLEALKLAASIRPEIPFIFVSGVMGEEFAVLTLHMGATDYVLKNNLSRLLVAVRRAITEAASAAVRKRMEESLRLHATRMKSIMDTSLDAIIVMDSQDVILDWNTQATSIFGWQKYEVLGHTVAEMIIPPQHREAHARNLMRFLTTDEGGALNRRTDITALHRTGREFPVELAITATKINEQWQFTAFIMDNTERKEAEEAKLARLSSELANQAKSEFLSRMSHELRTPLNAVLGFAQLLEMETLSPEQQEHVQHILKGGRHLLTLINEVLDIARIEAGRMTLSLEPVSVSVVIGEAVDLVRPQAAAHNIQLVTPSVREETVYVRADQQRLKQVLLNLLSNGVNYNREGGTLTVSGQVVPEGRYRMTITDTGSGIPPALLSRLFTPFDRLGADSRTEGTGLGLVLSRSLITVMGGTISVDSVVGRGTSVSVELPLSEPPAIRAETVSDKVQVAAPVSGGAFTILYIEDNLPNYQLIECLVEKRPGVRLLSAMQGKLGVELAASHRPDLILLDLNLPDIQGDEVLLRLRERPETAGIPVVMLSADAMQRQIDKLLAAGARGYLTKPIEVAQFYTLLDELRAKKGG